MGLGLKKKKQMAPKKKSKLGKKNLPNPPSNRAARRAERWGFELGKLSADTPLGGVSMGGLKMSNRSARNKKARSTGLGARAMPIAFSYADPQSHTVPHQSQTVQMGGVSYQKVSGTDLLGAVTSVNAGNMPGDLLVIQPIAPGAFGTTRLSAYDTLYQRYRFLSLRIKYVPTCPVTTPGALIGYSDFDANNVLIANSPENLKIAAAHENEAPNQVSQPQWYDMSQAGTFTDLFTQSGVDGDSDERLELQGYFYLIAASALTGNLACGNLYLEYEVLFSIPFVNPNSLDLNGSFSAQYVATTAFMNGSSPNWMDLANISLTQPNSAIGTPTVVFDDATVTIPVVSGDDCFISYTYISNQTASSSTARDGATITAVGSQVTGEANFISGGNTITSTGGYSCGWVSGYYAMTSTGDFAFQLAMTNAPTLTGGATYTIYVSIMLVPTPVLSKIQRRHALRKVLKERALRSATAISVLRRDFERFKNTYQATRFRDDHGCEKEDVEKYPSFSDNVTPQDSFTTPRLATFRSLTQRRDRDRPSWESFVPCITEDPYPNPIRLQDENGERISNPETVLEVYASVDPEKSASYDLADLQEACKTLQRTIALAQNKALSKLTRSVSDRSVPKVSNETPAEEHNSVL